MPDIRSFCELDAKGKRIEVHFPYSPMAVAAMRKVPGRRFVDETKGGPYWTIPKDMIACHRLRTAFGEGLEMGKGVEKWARKEVKRTRNLASLSKQDDAELENLPAILPELAAILRPFQRADVKMMSQTSVLNANEQGLGKTIETIAAIFEGKLDDGPQLVVCPKTSLHTVWKLELDTWVGDPVFILSGEDTPDWRRLRRLIKRKKPFWFLTTANQIRKGLPDALSRIFWKTMSVDEFHKTGLTNVSGDPTKGTQFGRKVRTIKRERTFLISGTPIGGKPIKLWGALNHMRPEVFTSKWRWAEEWLEIITNDFGFKEIGDLREDVIEQFYPAHAEFIVRRLKSEVLPQLPPKQRIDVWCDMTPGQRRQYKAMDKAAELRIDGQRLQATGVLAEYTRLKQFAMGERALEKLGTKRNKQNREVPVYKLPIKSSGKLEPLIERLAEAGIDPQDPSGDACAIVASQSKVFIEWISEQLTARGIRNELITGKVKGAERADLVKRFQAGGPDSPRVICCTTTAGGVSITLDRADTVHILDETMDPDDQQQLEDRAHRISRIHQVMVYYYRSVYSIEQMIYENNAYKAVTTENVMDIRRAKFKEAKAA